MSWFDSGNFSTFARSAATALKEAQKTIDKALDIQDGTQSPVIKEDKKVEVVKEDENQEKSDMTGSMWGSFTGSFFDNNTSSSAKDEPAPDGSVIASQPLMPNESPNITSAPLKQASNTLDNILKVDNFLKVGEKNFKSIFSSNVTSNSDVDKEAPAATADGWGWDTSDMWASATELVSEKSKKVAASDDVTTVTSSSIETLHNIPKVSEKELQSDNSPDKQIIESEPLVSAREVKDDEISTSLQLKQDETVTETIQEKNTVENSSCNIKNMEVLLSEETEAVCVELINSEERNEDLEEKPMDSEANKCDNKEFTDNQNIEFSESLQQKAEEIAELQFPKKEIETKHEKWKRKEMSREDLLKNVVWGEHQSATIVSRDDISKSHAEDVTQPQDVNITVQPCRTPIKIPSSMSIESDEKEDAWRGEKSGDEIWCDEKANAEENVVEPISLITKQPVSRSEYLEETDTSLNSDALIMSSSSSTTIIEVSSQSMQSSLDSSIIDSPTAPKVSETSASIPVQSKDECDDITDITKGNLPDLSSLEVSVESAGSSDTITHSMEISNQNMVSEDAAHTAQSLLCDAMCEESSDEKYEDAKEGKKSSYSDGESSPVSSMSATSGLVKIGGSAVTSGDECDTGTPSDIEVISTPSYDGMNFGRISNSSSLLSAPSRGWSAMPRFKNYGDSGQSVTSSKQESLMSASMTASFTSVSESDMGWGNLGNLNAIDANSPPHMSAFVSPPHKTYCEHCSRGLQSNVSETSDSSGEQNPQETEKLRKKVRELNEVLEVREGRVLELSQQNATLQDSLHTLQQKLADSDSNGGVESVREEFTHRLAEMEKKFQQALREKEAVSKLLDNARADAATRLSSLEFRSQIEEKEVVINELRREGEKLSKQQLQYSTLIKKLRSKEKESDASVASLTEKVQSQTSEIERQHKQLLVKGEVERRQLSAVTQLTVQLQQSEESLKVVRAEAAETESKMTVLREALDTAYRELADAKRQESMREATLAEQSLSAEVGAKQQLTEAMENLRKQTNREKQALLMQIEELNEERDRVEQIADRSVRQCRNEIAQLKDQLSESEGRGEEISSTVAMATRPLLRQIENLQASHSAHRQAWEELEAQLTQRLHESERQVSLTVDKERQVREESAQALSVKSSLTSQLDSARADNSSLSTRLQSLSASVSKMEGERETERKQIEKERATLSAQIKVLKDEMERAKTELEMEKTALREEKRRSEVLQQLLSTAQTEKRSEEMSRQNSPTPSLSKMSMAGSLNSYPINSSQFDDVFESASLRGGMPSLYESLRSNAASTLEALTSQLNQREGEVFHLHNEVSRHEAQKETFAKELLQLTTKMQSMEGMMEEHKGLKEAYRDLDSKYNALLQMYGEKVEEVDELKLDLSDVKEMYKNQINQLLQV